MTISMEQLPQPGLMAIAVSSPEELIASTMLDAEATEQRASRDAQRASRDARAAESRAHVDQLHDAADHAMYAGMIKASSTAASGFISAAGGDSASGWSTGVEGTGGAVGAFFQSEADHAKAAAATHQEAASSAADRAQDYGADAERAARTADKVLEQFAEVVQARRRAEDAALRA